MEYTEVDIEAHDGNKRIIRWMMRERFLQNSMRCERCLSQMHLERFRQSIDHWCWRCPRQNCKARISVRDGSFFAHSHFTLRQQMKILVNFIADSTAYGTAKRLRIDRHCVEDMFIRIRERFAQDLVTTPLRFDNGLEFEVDELIIKHVREGDYILNIQWVQGILERSTGKVYYHRVDDRRIPSLVPPVLEWVPDGSFVYTDEHRSYICLRDYRVHHFSVNHSAGEYSRTENLGPFQILVSINDLEAINRIVRARLRNRSLRTVERLDMTLQEIMYRRSGRSLFEPVKV